MAYDELGPAEIDRLADYLGGALDGPDGAEVARLIADDPRWRETYELLAPGMIAVGAELRAMGAVAEPMPADLAVRLDEALAAAPAARPERHLSLVPSRPRRRLRWAVPVAAAAGVLAFAGFGIDYLAGRQTTTSQADGSASSAEQSAPMMGTDSAGVGTAARDARILETGTNYTAASLSAAPAAAVTTDRGDATKPAPDNRAGAELGAGELSRLRAPAALQACVDAISRAQAAGPITVETVDYARYDSRPALVVRFTSGTGTWAYAVGPDCGTPDRGTDLRNRVQVR